MATEPTLEQLSAYVDGELDAPARAELETHLKTCSSCRARLEGLRQTVYAVRALPMETPPRAFTVPAQRRQSWRWAPAGWIGGTAAALLLIAAGISQLHGLGGANNTANSSGSAGLGAARVAVAPLSRPQLGAAQQDHNAYSATVASAQQVTVSEPGNSGRSLMLSTDARSYSANGVLTLRVSTQGLSPDEARTVAISLGRDPGTGGYAVKLAPPADESTYPKAFEASYAIADMHLQAPPDGNYSLQVTVDLSGGSSLIVHLPIAITP
jgi:negative regulator of sigma E activity